MSSTPDRPPAPEPTTTGPGPTISPEHHTRRRYEVRHRTTYTYEEYVTDSYGRAMLRPRSTPQQRIIEHDVEIVPEPHIHTEHVDHFGNFSSFYEVRTPHTVLEVSKRSIAEVDWPAPDMERLDSWTVAEVAAAVSEGEGIDRAEAAQYLLPSSLVDLDPEVIAYAAGILPPDRPFGSALMALYSDIYRDFTYAKGATSVKTTLPELLRGRAGVCQDFAHLAIGCLRAVGIPARYVSGYIETRPPPGEAKLEGSDASHAWAAAMTPEGDWVDIDPTNNHFADSRYIVTGWGRDFRDVSPLKGIIFSEGSGSTLDVGVDVIRLGTGDPRESGASGADDGQ
ncbi:transglutaminase family protein [Janibacter cremeus]|uniref:transglutaminase family protein n=1 Tax=Janibacter cremeus TaxID=1285192 RepID=UPI0023F6B760|nr:transglutaminase family protein [Janibacter cremeus]WEV77466.1 transglutaminase family protein [Janibacter cremeus]